MSVLIILNEGPYAGERAFNALRLALALRKQSPEDPVRLFLLSDGVLCGLPNQLRPEGSTNLETMLADAVAAGVEVRACTTCIDHRGLFGLKLIEGVVVSTILELADWVTQSGRVVTF